MITSLILPIKKLSFVFVILLCFPFSELQAQRLRHSASRGGAARANNFSRPSTNRSPNFSRSKQKTTRPNRNINNQRNTSNTLKKSKIKRPASTNNRVKNKVNVDRSRNNVNINVDNSKHINVNNRNTRVVSNSRHYSRPPYIHGGWGYYSFRPYYYHPYRPYYWGPVWHPWGFFITTLTATAIIISVENQQYHYDQGVYYVKSNDGYTVVQAPVGATIETLPEGTQTVQVNETTNNYYYGGTYYEKDGEKYTVVPPTAGTIVPALPEGGEEVRIGEQTYVQYGETYYQPVQVDGKNMYEVVEVKKEE